MSSRSKPIKKDTIDSEQNIAMFSRLCHIFNKRFCLYIFPKFVLNTDFEQNKPVKSRLCYR